MKKSRKKYSLLQQLSATLMVLALLWLTISAPFVVAAQQLNSNQDRTASTTTSPLAGNDEEAANPFGNTTEEKAPSNNSVSEEYLHDNHKSEYFFSICLQYHKGENASTYIAYHGELHVPPPNAA